MAGSVGDGKVTDVLAELPLKVALLPLPEQVRLVKPEEAADAGPLPDRGAEVDVAGVLFRHPKDDVDVALIVGGTGVGKRQRLLEEAEVRDVLVRVKERVLAEHVARE